MSNHFFNFLICILIYFYNNFSHIRNHFCWDFLVVKRFLRLGIVFACALGKFQKLFLCMPSETKRVTKQQCLADMNLLMASPLFHFCGAAPQHKAKSIWNFCAQPLLQRSSEHRHSKLKGASIWCCEAGILLRRDRPGFQQGQAFGGLL